MNKTKLILSFTLAIACLVPLCGLVTTGCASKPQRILFQATSASKVTIETALSAWDDYIVKNHPPVDQEVKVSAALDKYKLATLAVIDASQAVALLGNSATNTPAGDDAQLRKTAALQGAANTLAELVELLRSFGVQIH